MGKCWIFLAVVFLWSSLSWASVAPESAKENSLTWQLEKNVIDAIHSRGRRQIMAANISLTCREMALAKLAQVAAADSSMNCTSATDYAEDVGEIVLSVWTSIGKLMDDINTIINSIPICMSGYEWWNYLGKMTCFFSNYSPVWQAIKDFWHYKNFWMDPYNEIKSFIDCINNKKSITTNYVSQIVNDARYCE